MTADVRAVDRPSAGPRLSPAEVKALKARDNVTNIYYVARAWLIAAVTMAVAIANFLYVDRAGLGWWWDIPAAALAVIIIGACQHQLGGVVHEGTHYVLFANRRWSEIWSDWLGAFPIYTSTYAFRLHHLAHHQFVNDPERDPNFGQAEDGGYWLDFPLAHVELLLAVLRQLWPPNLIRYMVARARYSALGVDSNPYADPERPGNRWTTRFGVLYMIGVPALVIPLLLLEAWTAAFLAIAAPTAAILLYYALVPAAAYPHSRIEPVISHRATAIGRIVFIAVLYTTLTAIYATTLIPAWAYFLVLWIVPLFTTFPLFMILREWLQHGNADRGRYTNSRIFLVNPFLRFAVFPFGQDFHLPHHIVAAVPHYRLRELHALLRRDPEYRAQAREVEGWARPPHPERGRPTIVDVLGPDYAPGVGAEAHIDPTALEHAEINDAAAIARQVALSRQRR